MNYNSVKQTFYEIAQELLSSLTSTPTATSTTSVIDYFSFAITIFVLACFVGYYVVWKVTPALHTPLMSLTNAISSIIIIGGIASAEAKIFEFSNVIGFIAIFFAAVNLFGGFIITKRMLDMFKKNK